MRVTMVVRNTAGLKAKRRARTVRQKQRVLAASQANLEHVFNVAQSLAVRDTSFSAEQMQARLTRGGYNYLVGFFAEDFLGKVNPVTGKTVDQFYIVFVLLGTRFMAGRDYLTAAQRLTRESVRRRYIAALRV